LLIVSDNWSQSSASITIVARAVFDPIAPTYSITLANKYVTSQVGVSINFSENMQSSPFSLRLLYDNGTSENILSGSWITTKLWTSTFIPSSSCGFLVTVMVNEARGNDGNDVSHGNSLVGTYSIIQSLSKTNPLTGIILTAVIPSTAVTINVVPIISFDNTISINIANIPSFDRLSNEYIYNLSLYDSFIFCLQNSGNHIGLPTANIQTYAELSFYRSGLGLNNKVRLYAYNPSTNLWTDIGITLSSTQSDQITYRTSLQTKFALVAIETLTSSSSQQLLINNPLSAPNPFNPLQEVAHIGYFINSPVLTKLYIYSINGLLIHTATKQSVVGYNEFEWDGRSSFGYTIGSDLYYAYLVAENSLGKAQAVIKIVVKK